MIVTLMREKLPRSLIELVAKKERSAIGEGIINMLGKLNERALTTIYRAIVERTTDNDDYLNYRMIAWLAKHLDTSEVKPGYVDPTAGEIDIALFTEAQLIAIAECATHKVNYSEIEELLSKIKAVKGKHSTLTSAFFISSGGYDDGVTERLRTADGMNSGGVLTAVKKGRFSGFVGGDSGEVKITIYEERDGREMISLFP